MKTRRMESVTCPDCGQTRLRVANKHYVNLDGMCQPCGTRRSNRARIYPVKLEPTEDMRQWWLERYSMEEIRELARGLTGGFRVESRRAA